MRLREKIDGFLLLNVYFIPILIGLAWILGSILCFTQPPQWMTFFWAFLPLSVYSAVGNFAPFFEVAIGAYLDRRVRIYWLMPLLLLSFLYNVLVCSKALLDLCAYRVVGSRRLVWRKTLHNGKGNNYINIWNQKRW